MAWEFAGTKVSTAEIAEHKAQEAQLLSTGGTSPSPPWIITRGNEQYRVELGYCIPYFPVMKAGEEESVVREKLAIDLTKRFFRNAELGINVRFSKQDIADLYEHYKALPADDIKRATGALLVGAVMNRIERLSHAVLQNKALLNHKVSNKQITLAISEALDKQGKPSDDSIHDVVDITVDYCRALFTAFTIDQTLEHDKKSSTDDRFAEYAKEISSYYTMLISDQDMVRCVRRRNRATDREGVLYDMIRDAGKPWKIPLESIHTNRVQKIATAMRDIDKVADLLIPFVQQPPFDHCESLAEDIRHYADLAKRRAGIKTDDAASYVPVEVDFKVCESRLHSLIGHEIKLALDSTSQFAEGFELIRRGIRLIDDMAEIRQSRNEWQIDKPAIQSPDMSEEDEKDVHAKMKPAVDRLEDDLHAYSGRRIIRTSSVASR